MIRQVQPTGSGNPQIINFRPSPLALAVWNNVTKTILLAKEVELGAWPHPSVDSKEDHPSKNHLEPRNFSQCSLWSSVPTARCKPRMLQLETLPQYVSHKAITQERSNTQFTTRKKEGGGILISKSSIPVHTSIYMVFKKNQQSQPIISNGSTISSRLQMKTQTYRPFPP